MEIVPAHCTKKITDTQDSALIMGTSTDYSITDPLELDSVVINGINTQDDSALKMETSNDFSITAPFELDSFELNRITDTEMDYDNTIEVLKVVSLKWKLYTK